MAKNMVKKAADGAANKIRRLSSLSTEQVLNIQLQREEYLTNLEKINPEDKTASEITERILAANSIEIYNAYLPQIKELYLPVQKDIDFEEEFKSDFNIRYVNLTKWVVDKDEDSIEKLINVYAVLSNEECNIALVFNRTQNNTNVYLAVVNTNNAKTKHKVNDYNNRLVEAIKGNFPGSELIEDGEGVIPCLKDIDKCSVATASNIPAEKSEKFKTQTIEKLLDGIVPHSKKEEYTIILLATPILDVDRRKLRLGEIYSGLSPYESWSTNFTIMENKSESSGATVGVNVGASAGIQNGQNYSITDSKSESENENQTISDQTQTTKGTGDQTSDQDITSELEGDNTMEQTSDMHSTGENTSHIENNGTTDTSTESDTVGGGASLIANVNYSHTTGDSTSTLHSVADGTSQIVSDAQGHAVSVGKTAAKTITKGVTKTISNNIAKTTGRTVANTLGKAVTTAMATTSGIARSTSFGANFGANFARSSTVTAMIGSNEGLTRTFTNYNIKHALEILENQMKRLEQSTALGMWDFAAYVISEDVGIANNVAHSYLALTLGNDSYMSKSAVNLWRGNTNDESSNKITEEIISYIKELRHPIFGLNPELIELGKLYEENKDKIELQKYKDYLEYNEYPSLVTATTSLSGKELAYSLNFPRKSVTGFPVLECTAFGRDVITYKLAEDEEKELLDSIVTEEEKKNDVEITLGSIVHMNRVENTAVTLSADSLASHAFITGSTGSGKSNTVYKLIKEVENNKIHYLVIEPAKGEYKHVFKDGVTVYSTNPSISSLLRLNPFSFPDSIHILEHLDRLVEIFNVCWPMYAAMPAVLKNAVEKSYEEAGWDLLRSENKYDRCLYPGFSDVSRNIKKIIESSEYDNENKGAYKGSLLTRLQSLTTGINGLVFSSNELSPEELFDKNVIIDLSRVGSTETKSLIMGLLVLKLQEYRMSLGIKLDSNLRHITVIEEAHNLLRRTSIEQSSESSNILGKSVEMISNAIAEMRTYGEGFIIVDQAPGLMDMSVIRNTNTKIIMRLPDETDRELVGKAANLTDDQVKELSKLPCGVAAVYQNEWIQPVLCKVDKMIKCKDGYKNKPDVSMYNDEASNSLLSYIMDKELSGRGDKEDLKELKNLIINSNLGINTKLDFLEYLDAEGEKAISALRKLVFDFFDAEKAIDDSSQYDDINEWVNSVVSKLNPDIREYSNRQINIISALIIYEKTCRDSSYSDKFNSFTDLYRSGGGLF